MVTCNLDVKILSENAKCVRSAALRMSQSTVEKFRLARSNSAAAGIFCSTDRPHDLPGGSRMKFKEWSF